MPKPKSPPPPEWLDTTKAAALVGLTPRHIRRMGERGHLTVRDMPGVRAKYRRDEVLALLKRCIRPAAPAK